MVLCGSLAVLTTISFGLTFWRWRLHLRFPLHQRGLAAAIPAPSPGVTFLKPLKGSDAGTEGCLRSWFAQEYPAPVQLLFGVAAPDDPVIKTVQRLITEHPNVNAQLLVCPEALGANRKVSTLRQLEPHAIHPLLIISDADTFVPPDFVREVAARCGPQVGLVNCFYRLGPPATLAMRWEAIAVNSDFWSSVLQSAALQNMNFALGAVMTLPASELSAIGGFAALADCLADDYQLGRRIAARGRRLELAPAVAECREPPAGWRQVWRHQLRWARTIRACQPAPFAFSILNNGGFWPLLLLTDSASVGASPWIFGFAIAALLFRIITAQQQQGRMTGRREHRPYWWLVPVKDVLDFFLWAAAFWPGPIEWRGERYRVGKDGLLQRL